MMVRVRRSTRAGLVSVSFLTLAVATAAAAQEVPATVQPPVQPPVEAGAQTATPPAEAPEASDIIVTGIRGSLQSATNAKRDSVAFGDSIFAEDIGKLPATNLAETLNRIPGVRLNRDINGEGVQVAIRGLGPSFSKVLLNGAQIAVASDGGTNGGSANREVDLDFFPSELFTRLDVIKTPMPSILEGGIAGTVNLRAARPFDKPGTHVTVVAQGQYTDSNARLSPRGAIVASKTFGDVFGILVGVAGVKTQTRVDGFESVGWTDANLTCPSTPTCNTGADNGNGFTFASVAPPNVGNGLTPGATLNLAQTSGLTLEQLTLAKLPRLGRNSVTDGTRERISGLVSMEFRPTDTLKFAVDGIYAWSKRDYYRANMTWQVRNSGPGTSFTSTGGMVPIGVTVDENDVVTKGTFANSSFIMENNIFKQTTDFWNVNPSVSWEPADDVKIDLQGNYGKSHFFREQPSFIVQTAPNSGVVANYDNSGDGPQPVITSNIDLANPNAGWRWYRANVSLVDRKTDTQGAHLDVTLGDQVFNVKLGAAYDRAKRQIRAFDNSNAYQAAICGADCGFTGTGTIPNAALAGYIRVLDIDNFGHLAKGSVGYSSMIVPDFKAIQAQTNYESFKNGAPQSTGAVTGGGVGDIEEKNYGAYLEFNGATTVLGGEFRVNGGVRYVKTDQRVAAPVTINGVLVQRVADASYDEFLPMVNLTWDPVARLKVRFAASRNLTRADAGSLLPNLTFSDPSAQTASAGNPDLRPYLSNNIDLGAEFYTGGLGYLGVVLFRKTIDGFTDNRQTIAPYSSLGLDFAQLGVTQQNALTDRSRNTGVAIADLPILVTQPVNLNTLKIKGIEGTWLQPLDFLVKGLGFSANVTRVTQSSESSLVATGVAPWTYNLQGFYEDHGLSISVNYVWNDEYVTINRPTNVGSFDQRFDARGQLDLSVGYQLPFLDQRLRLTVDALNLTNEPIRQTQGTDSSFDNVTYSAYYPGRQILFGIRASF